MRGGNFQLYKLAKSSRRWSYHNIRHRRTLLAKLPSHVRTIQPCLTAVTSVSDGLKGLYNEKLKPLEQTYRFNDFASPTLTEIDGHAFGSILDRKNQFYQILDKVQLSRKKALFNGTPDFSMPYNAIKITCTVFSLYFGSLLNALHRRTEEEERLLKSKGYCYCFTECDGVPKLLLSLIDIYFSNLVEEKDKKVKELQDKIAAVNFTPESKMGKMLMDKCRILQEENEEIGNQANEGKVLNDFLDE
ncbi:EH domain-containing protein 2 [Capsicum baccatum]|uniref:EH domain-containing protein 2 n=1 Tax=Capsicum baccatum TaxID=33114 RepID=A0A2G2X2S3_CAPBA|nr:EH domain-containing protein 2 [Capsicum baccatum]